MHEYCWNGIGLTVPDGWEPAALERDGFLLESRGIPRCELKWRVIQGTFSFSKHLKRLVRSHKGVQVRAVALDETPTAWQDSVRRLEESGMRLHSFFWQGEGGAGLGAAMHNPASGLAALTQFFIANDTDEVCASRALATFRDYSGGRTVPWAMFGLRGRVPAEYVLQTFSFKPGHYMVRWWLAKSPDRSGRPPTGKGCGTSLVFERFAPASVLLKGTTLDEWTRSVVDERLPLSIPLEGDSAHVLWKGAARASFLRTFLRRTVLTRGRVWTTETQNAILVVRANGVLPIRSEHFNAICESYELV